MKREIIVTAIKKYSTYTMNKGNGDKGKAGKVLEVITRDRIYKKGISSIADVKARSINRIDVRSGKFGGIEIKSGSGAVAYAETDGMNNYINPFTKEDCVAENVLPKAKLIIWYPWGNMAVNSGSPFKYGFVFTREQFIDCLATIGKNGLRSSLKISKNGGQLNIQTIAAKLEDRLYDYLENIPSVEEYFGE